MGKPRMSGFQKPARPKKYRPVRVAVIRREDNGVTACSCGWVTLAFRDKVREDAVDRHLLKRHGGQGVRL